MKANPPAGPSIRLVASDVGGTLTGPSGAISERTAGTLRALLNRHVGVALLTGYNLVVARRFRAAISDPRVFLAAQNGAVVLAGERVISRRYLPAALAVRAVRHFLAHGLEAVVFLEHDGGQLAVAQQGLCTVLKALASRGVPTRPVPDLAAAIAADPVHVSVAGPREGMEAPYREARDAFGQDAYVVYGISKNNAWVEVNHQEARKSVALATIQAALGVAAAETMYFGDALNDCEAMAGAGHPVAVADGLPEVRELAGRVCPPAAEDGVALYLERFFELSHA